MVSDLAVLSSDTRKRQYPDPDLLLYTKLCNVIEGFRYTFVAYMKLVEGKKITRGFHLPYDSPEGGLPTVGYGHKMLKHEIEKFKTGLTEAEAEELLILDLCGAATLAARVIGDSWVDFDQVRKEICIDFVFNLGLVGFSKFKKLIKALIEDDWAGIQLQYKRYFKTPAGERRELIQRNREFSKFFLKE